MYRDTKLRQADNFRKYKTKQIPKMNILYSRYSRKNKKTTESVIFRVYSKDIVNWLDNIFGKKTKHHRHHFFLNVENTRCPIFGICYIFCIMIQSYFN